MEENYEHYEESELSRMHSIEWVENYREDEQRTHNHHTWLSSNTAAVVQTLTGFTAHPCVYTLVVADFSQMSKERLHNTKTHLLGT